MWFYISKIEDPSFLSAEMRNFFVKDCCQILPSEKLISELSLPNDFKNQLRIKPSIGRSDIHKPFLEAILDMDINSSDVFVCSLPKCGSNWLQTIVWLLTHGLDYETSRTVRAAELMAYFDSLPAVKAAEENARRILAGDDSNSLNESTALKKGWNEEFECLGAPRILKTHLPVYFLPKALWAQGSKVIYIVRNPKDMAVSDFHFKRNFHQLNLSMDDVVTGIMNDMWTYGSHSDHILNFWSLRHLPNVLFVTYEDLVTDSLATIKMISQFLDCSYTDQQLKELTEFISYDNMKNIDTINGEEAVARMEDSHGKKRPDADFK